ncbi:MAG TPA: hypothetical protein VHM90_14525 [Phycisphaerae bacterium]|nr:hypothetical protein [Phycisphaerae bacterium]
MPNVWKNLGCAVPAGITGVAGAALGVVCLRYEPTTLVGWAGILLLVATVAAACCGHGATPLLAGSALVAVVAAVVGAVGARYAGMSCGMELAAVAAAWTGLWAAASFALRRFHPVAGRAMVLALAMALFASPVIAMPAVHAAGTGTRTQRRLVEAIRRGCPMFACTDALKPRYRIDWAVLPGMYAMSGLGQEVPMELPDGWTTAGMYAGGALLAVSVGVVLRRKSV